MTREPKTYALRGGGNALLTVSLFLEPWQSQNVEFRAEGLHPVFSMTGKDGYVDVHQTFLETRDPTGVIWAEIWLEGVNHLNRLMKCDWFVELFSIWQEECEQLVQAEALQKIRSISTGGSPAAFQAAKYLAGREWKKNGRGRPSKASIAAETRAMAEKLGQHQEDLDRITGNGKLKVVK